MRGRFTGDLGGSEQSERLQAQGLAGRGVLPADRRLHENRGGLGHALDVVAQPRQPSGVTAQLPRLRDRTGASLGAGGIECAAHSRPSTGLPLGTHAATPCEWYH